MNDIELILKYQQKELSALEAIDFDTRLANDNEFSELFSDVSEADQLLVLQDMAEAKNILDSFDYSEGAGNKGINKWWIISGAILSGSLLFYFLGSPSKNVATSVDKIVKEQSIAEIEKSVNKPIFSEKTIDNQSVTNSTKATLAKKNSVVLQEYTSNLSVDPVLSSKQEAKQDQVQNTSNIISNPCNKTISASFETEPACIGESNGKILLRNIKGAQKPYKVLINNDISSSVLEINNLKASDNYIVKIIDANNCESQPEKVKIEETQCAFQIQSKPKPFNYLISLLVQNELLIKDCPAQALLEIRDQNGLLILKKDFTENQNVWDLQTIQGNQIGVGYYFYKLVDKQTGEEKMGNITITE